MWNDVDIFALSTCCIVCHVSDCEWSILCLFLLHEIFRCPPPQSKKQNKKSSIFVKKSYVSEWVGYFMMRLCVWIFLILAKKGMPKNHENFKQVVLLLQ